MTKPVAKSVDHFRFRSRDMIGVADAAEDKQFLQDCFVDTGTLEVLNNCEDARCLVLGRPGSGKTALLLHLQRSQDRVIEISPEDLALSHLSNSTILKYVTEDLGVSLSPFFRVLWQHVFTVEMLRRQFSIKDANAQKSFFSQMWLQFRSPQEVEALRYLEDADKSFWNDTEHRVKEETNRLENNLTSGISAKAKGIGASLESVRRMTTEEKQEVIHHATQIVNDIHIKKLPEVTKFVFNKMRDRQKRYYIVIDRLDEDWVDDRYRYQLIRALIEAARQFNRDYRDQVKIVIGLRRDLIERVFRATQDPGFQAEKYQTLYINLHWSKANLEQVLDTRIDHLVRSRYTAQKVGYRDLLPSKAIDKVAPIDYILQRTLMRPRDLIDFFNKCISLAEDSPKITEKMIKEAELGYSKSRLQALLDEWRADYPHLSLFVNILKKQPSNFAATDLTVQDCEDLCLQVAVDSSNGQSLSPPDDLTREALEISNGNPQADVKRFRRHLLGVLYRVGFIGLRLESFQALTWSHNDHADVDEENISDKAHVHVHPCVWRALGIVPKKGENLMI